MYLSLSKQDFMGEATQSRRCDTVFNLIKKGCQSDFIENPMNSITTSSDHEANMQVTPGKVSIHLRPGLLTPNINTIFYLYLIR